MTRKRMNTIIALSVFALYLICIIASYNISNSLCVSNFTADANSYVDTMSDFIDGITFDREDAVDNLEDLEYCMAVSSAETYPSMYAVYDDNGNIVFQNGSYIYSVDTGLINVEEYMTAELIQQYEESANELVSYPALFRFDYCEENGKIVPINLYFKSYDEYVDKDKKTFKLQLNDKQPTNRMDSTDKNSMEFTINHYYDLNTANKKILSDLKDEYAEEKIKQKFADTTIGEYGESGGSFEGPDEYKSHKIFSFDEKTYYYFVVDVRHNTFYDTITSRYFVNNVVLLSVVFSIFAIVLFVLFNVYYKKNKMLNDARQTFTSAAAHELKTPITIINNQCECLLEDVAPEKKDEYITNIYRQNRHMSNLVNNLLQYNRIDFASLEKTSVNIGDLCRDELEKYDALIESKRLTIITDDLANATILADSKLMRLVIDNYLSNAVKYTNNAGRLIVSCDEHRFSVFNEGRSIPDSDKNKIWDIFSRGTGDEVIKSTGMGLALCKKILETHKLKYGFVNKTNGVEFYFEY